MLHPDPSPRRRSVVRREEAYRPGNETLNWDRSWAWCGEPAVGEASTRVLRVRIGPTMKSPPDLAVSLACNQCRGSSAWRFEERKRCGTRRAVTLAMVTGSGRSRNIKAAKDGRITRPRAETKVAPTSSLVDASCALESRSRWRVKIRSVTWDSKSSMEVPYNGSIVDRLTGRMETMEGKISSRTSPRTPHSSSTMS